MRQNLPRLVVLLDFTVWLGGFTFLFLAPRARAADVLVDVLVRSG